jgi:NTP-dependent ternary system trypsin peptidase co-occuring protein
MAEERFDLAEVLGALHADLRKAEHNVQGDARLFVSEAEVEITFTVERSREQGGGLNLKVFGVGAEGSGKGTSGREDVQRITLKLLPHGALGVAGRPGDKFGE